MFQTLFLMDNSFEIALKLIFIVDSLCDIIKKKIVFSRAKKETKRNLTVIECLSKVGGKSFTVRNPLMSMSGAWASLWRRRSVFCDEKSPGKRETS